MAIKRIPIDGFGQIELNNVAFRRDGRIEAQCALDGTDFASVPAENGMLLAVNNVARKVELPGDKDFPIALHYSTEHMYDERKMGLKDFSLSIADGFYPRLGYLAIGDKFTTNCIAVKDDEYTDVDALKDAITPEALATTPVYGGVCENGAILVSATKPVSGPVLMVVKSTTMPDGQFGIKFQAIKE